MLGSFLCWNRWGCLGWSISNWRWILLLQLVARITVICRVCSGIWKWWIICSGVEVQSRQSALLLWNGFPLVSEIIASWRKKDFGRFHPLHCDVGPTKQWGYPDFTKADFTHDRGTQFLLAAWKPWSILRAQKINPDFVLIDGRWRVPSFLAAVVNCQAPLKVLFDDYLERKHYHVVESIQGRPGWLVVQHYLKSSPVIIRLVFFYLIICLCSWGWLR